MLLLNCSYLKVIIEGYIVISVISYKSTWRAALHAIWCSRCKYNIESMTSKVGCAVRWVNPWGLSHTRATLSWVTRCESGLLFCTFLKDLTYFKVWWKRSEKVILTTRCLHLINDLSAVWAQVKKFSTCMQKFRRSTHLSLVFHLNLDMVTAYNVHCCYMNWRRLLYYLKS